MMDIPSQKRVRRPQPPLQIAVALGYVDIARILIDLEAFVDAVNTESVDAFWTSPPGRASLLALVNGQAENLN